MVLHGVWVDELERIRIRLPNRPRLEKFFAGFGFAETGRSPGWVRAAPGGDLDELLLTVRLGETD